MATTEVQSVQETCTEALSKDTLVSKLDELLELYLNTLDAYQKAHQQLTTHLSSGYFSLAQANFNNARGRFGQDYYDGRMQALRKVALSEHELKVIFAIPASSATQAADVEAESPAEPSVVAADSQTALANGSEGEPHASASKESKVLADPIRWFGILVPSTLRAAQASFISAVEGPIPQLSTLAAYLRKQEVDIGRLRKQIKKL